MSSTSSRPYKLYIDGNRSPSPVVPPARILAPLLLVIVLTPIIMSCYELAKELMFPTLSKWESHGITIVFSSLCATATSYVVLRRQHAFYQRVLVARTRDEAALAYERDLLHALMDNIPDTIYFKDISSRFTRINRAQATFLGVDDPRDAVGKTDFDFQAPELAQAFYDEEQQLVASGQPLLDRIELNPAADGQLRWFSASKAPIRNAAGHVIGIVGISRNITVRKLVEHEREQLIYDLQEAMTKIKTLRGLLPICASCKRIRDDQGYWNQLESYLRAHSEADFSHGICPACTKKLYGDLFDER